MDSAGAYAENLSDLNEREYVVRELSGESQREEPKSKRVLRR